MPYKLPESPTPPDDTSENASELGDYPERESLANNLPGELIILIMSYVSSSKDLRSCSTVCRLWTYAAQCRLFSVLTIEIPSEVKSWTKRFKESPHIRHAVTSLDLSLPIQRCTDRLLTKLLRKLPNVKSVRLECWDAAQVYRLKVLKGLESLVLYEVAEGDLVFVTRGIKKMEYLKKLEVSVDSGVTWTPSLLSKIGPVKAVKLKELAVMVYDDFEADEAQSVGHMLDWLNSIVFDHSELETLKLAWEDVLVWDQDPAGMETEKLVKLLESVNPRLSNLVLTLPDYQYDQSDEESDSEMITLDPCLG
ncbi:hypothetical protein VKT23_011678 [Stygiomarasmius scandens]|uniref:F-box domain-containing protein n=1 Tax=Marasmiellus scandens TaxID=2682957 RepID=A0ABR1J892_9AGAR